MNWTGSSETERRCLSVRPSVVPRRRRAISSTLFLLFASSARASSHSLLLTSSRGPIQQYCDLRFKPDDVSNHGRWAEHKPPLLSCQSHKKSQFITQSRTTRGDGLFPSAPQPLQPGSSPSFLPALPRSMAAWPVFCGTIIQLNSPVSSSPPLSGVAVAPRALYFTLPAPAAAKVSARLKSAR